MTFLAAEGLRQHFNDVAGEHAKCSHFFACESPCFLVQEYAEYGGFCIREPLGEQRGDDACKYIAGTAFGKSRVAGRNHVHATVGNRHVSGATLQHNRNLELCRKLLQVFRVKVFV